MIDYLMENDNNTVNEIIARIKYNETAQKFLSRTHLEPIATMVSFLDRQDLFPGQTVEVAGCSSSAKTELLIQVFPIALTAWLKNSAGDIGFDRLRFNIFPMATSLVAKIIDRITNLLCLCLPPFKEMIVHISGRSQ